MSLPKKCREKSDFNLFQCWWKLLIFVCSKHTWSCWNQDITAIFKMGTILCSVNLLEVWGDFVILVMKKSFKSLLQLLLLFFNWSIVNLQCSVSFWCTAKSFSFTYIYIYVYIYIYIYIRFFSIIVYYKILNIVSVLYSWPLFFIYYI